MAVSPQADQAWGFSALPAELRNRIYHLAVGGRIFHLSSGSQLRGVCHAGEQADEEVRILDIKARRKTRESEFDPYDSHHMSCLYGSAKAAFPAVGLLRVSRTTYREASPILYGCNEFQFNSMLALHQFIQEPIPTRLKMLRRITLRIDMSEHSLDFLDCLSQFLEGESEHEALKTAVSELEGLDTLRILLEISGPQFFFPNVETAEVIGVMSNLLPGRKVVCVYPTKTLPAPLGLGEEEIRLLERLATGGADAKSSCRNSVHPSHDKVDTDDEHKDNGEEDSMYEDYIRR